MKNEKKSHRLLTMVCVCFAFIIGMNVYAEDKTYEGTIVSPAVVDLYGGFDTEYKGIMEYSMLEGTLFKGPILDKNGKVIKNGDIIYKLKTEYRDAQVICAKADIEKDLEELDSLKTLYERYKQINGTRKGAISEQDFLTAKNNYLKLEAQLKADKAALILAEKLRSICTFYAPFDGIVDKVFYPAGYLGSFGMTTMRISQLVPITVDIKMPRTEACKINVQTPVTVYPVGGSEPVGVLNGQRHLTGEDGIQLILPNYISTPKTKKLDNGKEVPVVSDISIVVPFNLNMEPGPLAVNKNHIAKDGKEEFVYKVVGQKTAQPGKGLDPVMKLQKVYIVTGDMVDPVAPRTEYIILKEKNSLEVADIIVDPKEVKGSDDTVYFMEKRYLFMPGDPVKVVIGSSK